MLNHTHFRTVIKLVRCEDIINTSSAQIKGQEVWHEKKSLQMEIFQYISVFIST